MKFILTSLLLFFSTITLADEKLRCQVCNMFFAPGAKTSFEVTKGSEKHATCSYSCGHRVHQRLAGSEVFAYDFVTGKRIPAAKAFFLIKSQAVLKEIPFDMPPTVVSFETKASAEATKKRLGDGEIISGFKQLEKIYE